MELSAVRHHNSQYQWTIDLIELLEECAQCGRFLRKKLDLYKDG